MTEAHGWSRRPALGPAFALSLGLALAAAPALAEPGWERLGGAGLETALTGAEVAYDGVAWQRFLDTGRVLSRSGEAPSGATSWGEWRVEQDSYCARMPPATAWECYRVEVDGTGRIRFTDAYGNATTGRFVPEEGAEAE